MKEAGPREGVFDRGQFEGEKRYAPGVLQVAVSIDYVIGWRCQSGIPSLKKTQVDLNARKIRLGLGTTKIDDGRLVYLTPELVELIRRQLEWVQLLEMTLDRTVPWLLPRVSDRFKGKGNHEFPIT